jgi:AraC-like DNA-binding protein
MLEVCHSVAAARVMEDAQARLSLLATARIQPHAGRMILPDACCDIAYVRGQFVVFGPMTAARRTHYAGEDLLLLRVDPLVARSWLGVPMRELLNLRVALRDLDADRDRELSTLLENGQIVSLVQPPSRSLRARIDRRLQFAVAALKRGSSVRAVSDGANLSERQLERLFADATGVSPRTFVKIRRLRRAIISAKRGQSFADAAAAHGYADQAHFSRDVKGWTGLTPSTLMPRVGNVQDVGLDVQ